MYIILFFLSPSAKSESQIFWKSIQFSFLDLYDDMRLLNYFSMYKLVFFMFIYNSEGYSNDESDQHVTNQLLNYL